MVSSLRDDYNLLGSRIESQLYRAAGLGMEHLRAAGRLPQGAIIARELGVPCVNGIVDLMELLADGDFVTVNGHLGIVTVGPPEFDLELEVIADEKS